MAAVFETCRHVLLSGRKLQNTFCTETFSAAVTRHKQQTPGFLRTNDTIVKGFEIHVPGKCFISSIMSKFWWSACHRQHKPSSSPEQRIFPLIFIATMRQIFCLSPLLLRRIRCHFFPSWIPFEHFNFSLRLLPHIAIKPDWSDFRDLNFDIRPSLRCPCTIDWQFSRPARLIFPSGAPGIIGNIRTHRMRVETIFVGLPGRPSLSPRVSPSRAPVLSWACYAGYMHFLLAEFSVRTVNYGTRIRNLQYGPKKRG